LLNIQARFSQLRVSNPLRLLYPNFSREYYMEKRKGRHYYSKKRG
jgi:hypothetical protein